MSPLKCCVIDPKNLIENLFLAPDMNKQHSTSWSSSYPPQKKQICCMSLKNFHIRTRNYTHVLQEIVANLGLPSASVACREESSLLSLSIRLTGATLLKPKSFQKQRPGSCQCKLEDASNHYLERSPSRRSQLRRGPHNNLNSGQTEERDENITSSLDGVISHYNLSDENGTREQKYPAMPSPPQDAASVGKR